jgi:hypothetical protein
MDVTKDQYVFAYYPHGNLEGEPDELFVSDSKDRNDAILYFSILFDIPIEKIAHKVRLIQVIKNKGK